jgi:hypothetical protein
MEGNLTTLCGGNKTAAKVGQTWLTLDVANDGKLWLASSNQTPHKYHT